MKYSKQKPSQQMLQLELTTIVYPPYKSPNFLPASTWKKKKRKK